jgi:hypothetical protein
MHWYTYLFGALAIFAFAGFFFNAQRGHGPRMFYSFFMLAVWVGLTVWTR